MGEHMTCYDQDECIDCGVDCIELAEYYMVTDACWERAGMDPHGGMLCVGCLEKRLGKHLQPRNFTDCPLNWRNVCIPHQSSFRLASRMLAPETSKWRRGVLEIAQEAASGDFGLLETRTLMKLNT